MQSCFLSLACEGRERTVSFFPSESSVRRRGTPAIGTRMSQDLSALVCSRGSKSKDSLREHIQLSGGECRFFSEGVGYVRPHCGEVSSGVYWSGSAKHF